MRNYIQTALIFSSIAILYGYAMMNPAKQAETFKDYDFKVESVNNLTIGGKGVAGTGSNISSILPGLAIGILRKDLPLAAVVNMRVTNTKGNVANLGAFKYLIEIQGKPFFEGELNQGIDLGNGQSSVIPLDFRANLFGVTDEKSGIETLVNDMLTRDGEGFVVLKIKPSLKIGSHRVYYPGYITVDNNLLKGIKEVVTR